MLDLLMAAAPAVTGGFNADLFKWVVGALLSGGTLTGYLTYKIQRRKAPVEVDSIVVQGAEQAVLAMKQVYEAEAAAHNRTREDNVRLRAENERQRNELEELAEEIRVLKDALVVLERRADAALGRTPTPPGGIPAVSRR